MVSKTLKDILDRVEAWPEERQEDAARVLIEMEEQDSSPVSISASQVEQVERRRGASHRKYVPIEQARKRFSIHRA